MLLHGLFLCFYVVNSNCGSGGERKGIAVVAGHLCLRVWLWLVQRQGLMVTVAAAVGLCYSVSAIAFSTRGCLSEKERSIRMLAFLFIPYDVKYTCCMIHVF